MIRLDKPNTLFGKWNFPVAIEIMREQQDSTWTAHEIAVDKDVNDYKNNMSVAQRNLIEVILQEFMEIEQSVGDIWFEIAGWWEQPDIEMCALEIGRMEKCVHALFYQSMSDELLIEPETIAYNQENIREIAQKLQYISKLFSTKNRNKLVTLGALALTEQVLLFGNFAVLKSFRNNGINLIPHTISGVQFVISDKQMSL